MFLFGFNILFELFMVFSSDQNVFFSQLDCELSPLDEQPEEYIVIDQFVYWDCVRLDLQTLDGLIDKDLLSSTPSM